MTEKCANRLKDNEEGSANIAFAVGSGIQEVAFHMKHVPGRAGSYEDAGQGYRMFIPAALPPDPPLELNGDTLNLPRLKSRDSCFIDRCHCWSYTVSTGVTSGSSCRTD